MSTQPVAVVDTSAFVDLMRDPNVLAVKEAGERELVAETFNRLKREGCKVIIPAPAYLELSYRRVGEAALAEVAKRFGDLRVEPFDLPAAETALDLLRRFRKKNGGQEPLGSKVDRKFDLQIAAIAVAMKARYLVTTNPKDFDRLLDGRCKVIRADQQPETGQLWGLPGKTIGPSRTPVVP
jgi:predicted nucleic acid-binding protein